MDEKTSVLWLTLIALAIGITLIALATGYSIASTVWALVLTLAYIMPVILLVMFVFGWYWHGGKRGKNDEVAKLTVRYILIQRL